jgi:hypothetical protein
VLSVLLQYTDSEYSFGTFKLLLINFNNFKKFWNFAILEKFCNFRNFWNFEFTWILGNFLEILNFKKKILKFWNSMNFLKKNCNFWKFWKFLIFLKILKFWNFWIFWNFESFWKFWTLKKKLCWKIPVYTYKWKQLYITMVDVWFVYSYLPLASVLTVQ